jgi:glycosyltransferase involved in cell wall biosynthesis
VHSTLGLPFRRAQLGLLDRYRGAIDRSVAPTRRFAEIAARHGWPCTDVVPHAVPPHARTQPRSTRPVAAYSGRLVREKGVAWLLDAYAATADRVPGSQLHIVGDGPDRSQLEAQTQRLGLAERVSFTGHLSRDESQRVLEAAWVQVVPSLWAEPFGLVAAEALMRETPVIASDAGGPAEIVEHGRTGWVVPAGDGPGLSAALVEALSDQARVEDMGRAGRDAAIRNHGEERWIESYLSIYGQLLAEHLRRAN